MEEGKKYGLYSQPLHFHFNILTVMKFSSIDYSVFIPFLCILEQQRAPSPPVSPIYGDGDATATSINGGDLPISDASKPMTFVLRYFPLTKKNIQLSHHLCSSINHSIHLMSIFF
jgi:hypothetical protein